jgi:thiamine pyrophosphate-dependent acetolactate synthase large subunit-like protein
VFPDVAFAAVAEVFGFQAYTIRSPDDLRKLGPVLGKPDGPILLDCKVNADIADPSWASSPNSKRDSTVDQESRPGGGSAIAAAAIS